jgi:CDP-glucose 4,6-dehydratase
LLAEKQHNDKSLDGSYNFGPDDDNCITTGTLAGLFCSAWGRGASWTAQEDAGPHEANFLKLDCSKAKAMLAWKPAWSIKTAVEKAVEFAKNTTDKNCGNCVESQIKEYFNV